jgi:hypothetical protein
MVLSIPVPQEIIDCIIAHLMGDSDSLKACTMVSLSFVHPSQKHLFSSITLDSSSLSWRLCDVISFNPELALFIQVLRIEDKIVNPPAWFATDKLNALPKVLNMMHNLQCLKIRGLNMSCQWDSLSVELRFALAERLASPILSEIHIQRITQIPISFLTHFINLTHIDVAFGIFDPQSPPISPPILLQARALRLPGRPRPTTTAAMTILKSVYMPRLRHLHMSGTYRKRPKIAEEVIRCFSSSIKSVSWLGHSSWYPNPLGKLIISLGIICFNSARPIDVSMPHLGMIQNLEYLVVTTSEGPGTSIFDHEFTCLISRLCDLEIIKELKELTVAIRIDETLPGTWDDEIELVANCRQWEWLDNIQWSPALQMVHISIERGTVCPPADVSTQLLLRMQSRLPQLVERGVLSAGIGTEHESQRHEWSRVWD